MIMLFNLRNVGHFTVHCHNLTVWALSSGTQVIYCGLDYEHTDYRKTFSKHPLVRFVDVRRFMGLGDEPLDDEIILHTLFNEKGMDLQVETICQLQKELSPTVTMILQADEYFFNYRVEAVNRAVFAAPTYGILTFGHRDRYTGHDEKYTWRLRCMPRDGRFFTRLLTIDEYHAAFEDPDQSFMVYLPDPYRQVDVGCVLESRNRMSLDVVSLKRFLEADRRPVVPVAGKFDERKNNLWVLEEVAARSDLRCAVIGDRVPSPGLDARIDDLLFKLDREGRLFCRFGFVSHDMFDILFSSPQVKFAAFPYLVHYGSSGVHLMAPEHGKPCLVPDNGIMGLRTYDAGIGLLFRHGDRQDFHRQFARLADGEFRGEQVVFSGFSNVFKRENLFAALDYAVGLSFHPPAFPGWLYPVGNHVSKKAPVDLVNNALVLAHKGNVAAGLKELDEALNRNPDHASWLFRRFVLLLREGNLEECITGLRAALAVEDASYEMNFFFDRMMEYMRELPVNGGLYDEDVLLPVLAQIAMEPDQLQELGVVLAMRGDHEGAEEAFATALRIDPERNDIRLNLSDVRRYDGRLADSLAILDEIALRDSDAPGLWCKRGQVFVEEGRQDEARIALNREIKAGGPFVGPAKLWLSKLM